VIQPNRTVSVLLIVGMKCPRCRQAVVEALESVPGVADVEVNLFRARASISHGSTCTVPALIRAVVAAGYSATQEASRRGGVT
jgi:copper chaperone CopZ